MLCCVLQDVKMNAAVMYSFDIGSVSLSGQSTTYECEDYQAKSLTELS